VTHFLFFCRDIADTEVAAKIRSEKLDAHLAYVAANVKRYAVAGPNRDAAGGFAASTFILDCDDLVSAQALMAADPYVQAGLYGEVECFAFTPAAGTWVGGITWAPR